MTQINVRKNFIRFVNNSEFDRLTKMENLLKQRYQLKGGWDDFYDNKAEWETLLFQSRPDNPGPDQFFPPPVDHFQNRNQPPHLDTFPGPPPQGFLKPNNPFTLHHRLCLFDADKQYVAGEYHPQDQFNYRAIVFSNQTIGWLGLKNRSEMIKPLELEFLKRQTHSFVIIGMGIFILAIMISYIMSKHLLSPIRELAMGARAMGNFDFNTKIFVHSTDELGGLANDFNLMAQTLKRYETLRTNWISDISHELRTPVAVIRSKIEALQDGIREMTPPFLDSLHNDVIGLGKLVNDLHLVSLADSNNLPVNLEIINLFGIVDRCLETVFIRLEHQKIDIQTDWEKQDRLEIRADANLLGRVFGNLFENTLRYTDSPGTLSISHAIKKNRLTLVVEDSSPGVPNHCLNNIFDRLYRVEQSRNRSLGGSGLGLSIAKQIVITHGGIIEASCSPLGGLKITIELPVIKK
ncbi:MAG: HAMP domain-containing protein [Proteobacteria bacterium]|nr:HAMP domain-containing protein [Pseudomonadota bacterium]MBU4129212.1 HAMP domain-containing protein [Pseudomonadota bacterium]